MIVILKFEGIFKLSDVLMIVKKFLQITRINSNLFRKAEAQIGSISNCILTRCGLTGVCFQPIVLKCWSSMLAIYTAIVIVWSEFLHCTPYYLSNTSNAKGAWSSKVGQNKCTFRIMDMWQLCNQDNFRTCLYLGKCCNK